MNSAVESPYRPLPALLQRLRVPLGFAFGLIYLVYCRPTPAWLVPGLITAAVGLLIRAWAAGHLRKHEALTISGPYRWTRNPLYLGSFLLGLGFSAASGRWWVPLLFLILFPAVYLTVMRAEERELRRNYGNLARHYIDRVPLFFPLKPPFPAGTDSAFEWSRFRSNQEHRAVIGALVLAVFLLVRQTIG